VNYLRSWNLKGFDMSQSEYKEQMTEHDSKMEKWQERSPTERRGDEDKRKKRGSTKHLRSGGRERRSGKERRDAEERRDRWIRIGKWRSESVFEE